MDAIDVQPTRLERAKLKIHDIMKVRQGSRTALVVYAATAHMVLPLSSDASLMDLYAQALSTDLIPPGRKDTRAALAKVDEVLSNEAIPGTIVFITCGVEQSAFAAFAQHNDNARNRALVLAVGTPEGGPLRSASGEFGTDNGRRIFSRLDVDSFKELKSSASVPVSTVTVNDDDVNWIQRHALNHLQAIQNRDAKVHWVDQGYWLTLPVALFTCLWFRKGWTIRWVASGIVFFALCQPQAASARDFHFIDFWLRLISKVAITSRKATINRQQIDSTTRCGRAWRFRRLENMPTPSMRSLSWIRLNPGSTRGMPSLT
jgi:Ca-activated chloride channel family protein